MCVHAPQFFFDFAKLADGDIELVTVITNAACIRYQLLGEALTPLECIAVQLHHGLVALAEASQLPWSAILVLPPHHHITCLLRVLTS